MKSRSHGSIPGTWSGGRQLISSALTPMSSMRRAMRPNSSPSGPPQCWPKTPHTPWRQRRKLTQTGMPDSTSASIAWRVRPLRTSVIVSSRIRSGASSSNARGSSWSSSLRASLSTSPLMLNASAVSPCRSASAIASRPTRMPRRAMSIQCSGAAWPAYVPPSISLRTPHVLVEITSQPASM